MKRHTRTIVRHEYHLPSPVDWGDMVRTLGVVNEDRKELGFLPVSGDALWIEADGDSVVLVWTETS